MHRCFSLWRDIVALRPYRHLDRLGLVVLAACGSLSDAATGPSGPQTTGGSQGGPAAGSDGDGADNRPDLPAADAGMRASNYSYHQHIRPILEARCTGCHNDDGIGPFALDDYELAKMWAPTAALAVADHSMPPFPPDDSNCRELEDARKMSDEERAMFVDWAAHGTPLGEASAPAEIKPYVPADKLGEPTQIFPGAAPYDPDTSSGDDYRCFLVDPQLMQPWTFLKSLGMRTNNWARIHHAIVYLVPPKLVASAQAVDAADAGPGWGCYFSPKVDGVIPAGGYAPGSVQKPYPGNTTIPIEQGTQFILEMHMHDTYNDTPVTFSVATWEFDEPLDRYPGALPMFTSTFVIPAGAPSVKAKMEGRFVARDQEPLQTEDPNAVHEAKEGLLWGADFHMHLRGKTARVDLIHADGTRECLLNIPKWDDCWQGGYGFKEPVRAIAGDRLEATCEWDNSAEHQPEVDGKRLTPSELRWGFKALDEMCNSSVAVTLAP